MGFLVELWRNRKVEAFGFDIRRFSNDDELCS